MDKNIKVMKACNEKFKSIEDQYLADIQNGKFESADSVKEYISTALANNTSVLSDKELARSGPFSLRILYAYNSKFEHIPSSVLDVIADVIVDCVHCVRSANLTSKDPYHVVKILYNLLAKFAKQLYLSQSIKLLDCLEDELTFRTPDSNFDPEICEILHGIHLHLWNSCIRFEQSPSSESENHAGIVFRIRISSMRLLQLSRRNLETCFCKRLTQTLDRTDSLDLSVVANLVETLLQDAVSQVNNQSEHLQSLNSFYYVEAILSYVKLLLKRQSANRAVKMVGVLKSSIESTDPSFAPNDMKALSLFATMLESLASGALLNQFNLSTNKKFVDFTSLAECIKSLNGIEKQLDRLDILTVRTLSTLLEFCAEQCNRISFDQIGLCSAENLQTILDILDYQYRLYCIELDLIRSRLNTSDESTKKRLHCLVCDRFSTKTKKLNIILALLQSNVPLQDVGELTDSWKIDMQDLVSLTISDKGGASSDSSIPCWKLGYKFGSHFYTNGSYENAIFCLNLVVDQLKFISEAGKSKLAAKCQIWKCYELLSDVLRKVGRLVEAFVFVVEGVIADGVGHLAAAAKQWTRLFSYAVESDNSPSFRTLSSEVIKKSGRGSLKFKVEELLLEELKALKDARNPLFEYHFLVLNELDESIENDQLRRASLLIEKALVARVLRKDGKLSPTEICDKAFNLLKEYPDKSSKFYLDLLAQTHLTDFILQEPDKIDELLKSNTSKPKPESLKARSSIDDEESDDDLFSEGSKAVWDCDHLTNVEEALKLWESCFENVPKKSTSVQDISVTMDCLEILVSILKLHQSPSLSRALQLLHAVSMETKSHGRCLEVATAMIQLQLDLKQPSSAEQLAQEAESFLANENVDTQLHLRFYVEFLIIRAEVYLCLGKLKESLNILEKVSLLTASVLKERSKMSFIMKGLTCIVESKLNSVVLSSLDVNSQLYDSKNKGAQLDMAVKGVRSLAGIVIYLFGDRNCLVSDSLADKWFILDLLLRALLYVGKCYVKVGDAREAKCYLQQGLRFSESFQLRKRFCEFHLVLAQLTLMGSQFDDCQAHLFRVSSVLGSASRNCSKGKKMLQRSNSIVDPDVSDESNSFLKSKSLTLDLQSISRSELGSSPPKRRGVKLPKSWEDKVGCDCLECNDLFLQQTQMSYHLTESRLSVKKRDFESPNALMMIAKLQDKLASKISHVLCKRQMSFFENTNTQVPKKTTSRKVDNKKLNRINENFSGEAFYQTEFIKIFLLLSEISLTQNDLVQFQIHHGSLVRMLDKDLGSALEEAILLRAEAQYLSSVFGFSWPDVVELSTLSDIDLLCAGIGRLSTSQNLKSGTPKLSSRSLERDVSPVPSALPPVVAAPIKKGRAARTGSAAAAVKKAPPVTSKRKQTSEKEATEMPRMSTSTSTVRSRRGAHQEKATSNNIKEEILSADVTSEKLPVHNNLEPNVKSSEALRSAFESLRFNPSLTLYRNICQALAVECMARKDPLGSAFYLAESHSITFRHNCSVNLLKKIGKLDESTSNPDVVYKKLLDDLCSHMRFGTSKDEFSSMIKFLPADWMVCQLSLIAPLGQSVGRLYVTRLVHGAAPSVVCLPGFSKPEGQKLLAEFAHIMKENQNSMTVTDKAEWWTRRKSLDRQLKDLLENLESQWIGCWRGMFLGALLNTIDAAGLKRAASHLLTKCSTPESSMSLQLAENLLNGAYLLDDREVIQAIQTIYGTFHENVPDLSWLNQIMLTVRQLSKQLNLAVAERGPVILVLDKDVQHLPWENFPLLEDHSVTRLISFHFLYAHLNFLRSDSLSVVNAGVDRGKVFYVVNPEQNLPNTQKNFQSWFESEDWKGVMGRPPTTDELTEALTLHDLFVYCGHGTGGKYMSGETLQMLRCHAAVLLMGCSSGRLTVNGDLEVYGMMLNYFLAGSGCIVGNLWDVTDRDIDRYLESLLKSWLEERSSDKLLDCTLLSRKTCRFRHLIGAAPVVYGFPVAIKK